MSDPTPPQVGPESDEYRAVCVYAPRPSDPQCDQLATVHILTDSVTYGVVTLASCDQHAGIARLSGRPIQEHVHEGVCGFPATLWNELMNRCVLDDTGIEPAVHRIAAVAS